MMAADTFKLNTNCANTQKNGIFISLMDLFFPIIMHLVCVQCTYGVPNILLCLNICM